MATATARARRSARSAGSRAARPAKQRKGSETPRIFTPPLRELTPQTSLGFACIEFAEQVCGESLYPWQKWLLIHALELAPGLTVSTLGQRGSLDPIFRFRKVVVLVARQNGKSKISALLSLFFMYELGTDLVLGTAQDLDTAEEVWDGALEIIEETPELAELADKPIRVNGKKTIRLLSGERYKVKAANRRAGRGLSGDLILLDELREHQSWDAWAAITKTTNARPAAMIWALSNAGDATSIVLRYLRKQAHADLGDPDGLNADDDPAEALLPDEDDLDGLVDLAEDGDDLDVGDFEEDGGTLGLFEWSSPPNVSVVESSPADTRALIEGLLQANPSTGYCISLRTLLDASRNEPEWVTKAEVLCQWNEGSIEGLYPPGSWEKSADEKSRRATGAEVALCVDVSWDRSHAHIGLATFREDDDLHVEVIASRVGTDWVVPWFTDSARSDSVKSAPVAIQKGSPAQSLVQPLCDAGVNVIEWGGSNLVPAFGAFYDLVRAALGSGRRVWHRNEGQGLLNVAAATAVSKPMANGGWVIDRRKSASDASPLIAVNGATWCLLRPTEKPAVSAYESGRLEVI